MFTVPFSYTTPPPKSPHKIQPPNASNSIFGMRKTLEREERRGEEKWWWRKEEGVREERVIINGTLLLRYKMIINSNMVDNDHKWSLKVQNLLIFYQIFKLSLLQSFKFDKVDFAPVYTQKYNCFLMKGSSEVACPIKVQESTWTSIILACTKRYMLFLFFFISY